MTANSEKIVLVLFITAGLLLLFATLKTGVDVRHESLRTSLCEQAKRQVQAANLCHADTFCQRDAEFYERTVQALHDGQRYCD